MSDNSKKNKPVLTIMVAASIVAVAAVSAVDYNHVYTEYIKTHENIPPVMACVDAVREGIFPWTEITAYALTDPGYVDEGPGVVRENTEKESIAENKTEEKETENQSQTEKQTETESKAESETAGTSEKETESEKTADAAGTAAEGMEAGNTGTANVFKKVDMSYLSDAAFVGDSFTQGLMLYSDIPGADFLNYQSKTTKNIMDSDIHLKNGSVSTVRKELSKKQYGKVYIMLGINELSKDAQGFAERYRKVIDEIRALQPGAVIYIQSILHTTPAKSANSNFKNDIIDLNNAALAGLADSKNIFYIDINPVFDDGTGALRSDYSADGVHLKASHYNEWRDHLLNYGVK